MIFFPFICMNCMFSLHMTLQGILSWIAWFFFTLIAYFFFEFSFHLLELHDFLLFKLSDMFPYWIAWLLITWIAWYSLQTSPTSTRAGTTASTVLSVTQVNFPIINSYYYGELPESKATCHPKHNSQPPCHYCTRMKRGFIWNKYLEDNNLITK